MGQSIIICRCSRVQDGLRPRSRTQPHVSQPISTGACFVVPSAPCPTSFFPAENNWRLYAGSITNSLQFCNSASALRKRRSLNSSGLLSVSLSIKDHLYFVFREQIDTYLDYTTSNRNLSVDIETSRIPMSYGFLLYCIRNS